MQARFKQDPADQVETVTNVLQFTTDKLRGIRSELLPLIHNLAEGTHDIRDAIRIEATVADYHHHNASSRARKTELIIAKRLTNEYLMQLTHALSIIERVAVGCDVIRQDIRDVDYVNETQG